VIDKSAKMKSIALRQVPKIMQAVKKFSEAASIAGPPQQRLVHVNVFCLAFLLCLHTNDCALKHK
jgi:hypothetical protein